MTHIGIDLSSFRLDYAWLDDRQHPVVVTQKLGNPRMKIQDRLREIDFLEATREIWATKREHSSVIIEKPMGRISIVSPLMAVVGAITAGIPKEVPVHWVGVSQLRSAIGAKNSKLDAYRAISDLTELDYSDWDEHEKDALVAAIGGALLIEQGVIQSKKTPKRKRT
jgi:hypothetical protein